MHLYMYMCITICPGNLNSLTAIKGPLATCPVHSGLREQFSLAWSSLLHVLISIYLQLTSYELASPSSSYHFIAKIEAPEYNKVLGFEFCGVFLIIIFIILSFLQKNPDQSPKDCFFFSHLFLSAFCFCYHHYSVQLWGLFLISYCFIEGEGLRTLCFCGQTSKWRRVLISLQ